MAGEGRERWALETFAGRLRMTPTTPTRRTFVTAVGALLAACGVPLGTRKAQAQADDGNRDAPCPFCNRPPRTPGSWLFYMLPGCQIYDVLPEDEEEMWTRIRLAAEWHLREGRAVSDDA